MAQSDTVKNEKIIVATFFVLFVAAFVAAHAAVGLVQDDTTTLKDNKYVCRRMTLFDGKLLPELKAALESKFRPFSLVIRTVGTAYFTTPGAPPILWFLFAGLVNALALYVYCLTANRFLRSRLYALLATALLCLSPPYVSASWITFAGLQSIVVLFFAAAMLLYHRYRVGNHRRSLIWMSICFLVGPYFREVLLFAPLAVLVVDFFYTWKPNALKAISLLGVLHALFPSVLASVIRLQGPDWTPSLNQVTVSSSLRVGFASLLSLNYYVLAEIVYFISPVFVLVTLACVIRVCLAERRQHPALVRKELLIPLVFLFVTLLPFLKVKALPMHLLYCLGPLLILVLALFQIAMSRLHGRKVLRGVLVAALCLAIVDQAAIAWGSYSVVRSMNAQFARSAKFLRSHVPAGCLVISNTSTITDVDLLADWHFKYAFTNWHSNDFAPDGIVSPISNGDLQALIASRGEEGIYVLAMEFPFDIQRFGFHANRITRNQEVALEYMGEIARIDVKYLSLDPLKWLLPGKYYAFIGSPDYETEFYHGKDRARGYPFLQVYAEHHLYRTVGKEVKKPYSGFTIVHSNGRYVAFPDTCGAFDEQVLDSPYVHPVYVGQSLLDAKSQIVAGMYGIERAAAAGLLDSIASRGTAVVSATDTGMSPGMLNDGKLYAWGSPSGSHLQYAGVKFDRPVRPSRIAICVFSTENGAHLRQFSVIGSNSEENVLDDCHILPARIGSDGAFSEMVDVPNLPDRSVVNITIDASSPEWKPYKFVGIASFPGQIKNHLAQVDNGSMYIRELMIYEGTGQH